jgi:hypothetical protein
MGNFIFLFYMDVLCHFLNIYFFNFYGKNLVVFIFHGFYTYIFIFFCFMFKFQIHLKVKKKLIDQFVSFTDKNPLFNGHNPIKSNRKI